MRLNSEAGERLRTAGISQAQWTRQHFQDGTWHGDACGCPDDRCIGHHHDKTDECGCLRALLAEHVRHAADRWKVRECTRCSTSLDPGADVYTLAARHYEPMPAGPEWECVGDWTEGPALGGWVCAACLDDLQRWLIAGRIK